MRFEIHRRHALATSALDSDKFLKSFPQSRGAGPLRAAPKDLSENHKPIGNSMEPLSGRETNELALFIHSESYVAELVQWGFTSNPRTRRDPSALPSNPLASGFPMFF